MKRSNLLIAVIGFAILVNLVWLLPGDARAQTPPEELPKFEVGVQFTSIDNFSSATEPGFGGRFTFNLNRSVALEAVGNFFPHKCRFCGSGFAGDNSGNLTQVLAGVKAGKRFDKWGLFAKARPGIVSFSDGDSGYVSIANGSTFPFEFQNNRATHFAVDLGAVLEFYPTKRIVTCFDAGDTLIHYGPRQSNVLTFDGGIVPFTTRAETRHNFQFAAGVGWRF